MKMHKTSAAAAAMLILFLAACGGSETTTTTETSATTSDTAATSMTDTMAPPPGAMVAQADSEFATKAATAGVAEVAMGNLALQKAANADVKAFAQRMVTDHQKQNQELQQMATNKGLTLPTEPAADQKAGMDHLNGLSGAEFDKAYMQHMVADHEKTVADFRTASTSLQDQEMKSWATTQLPILEEHLKQAQEISGKLK